MGRISGKRIVIFSVIFVVAALAAVVWLSSVATPRNLIVLLQDPDGKIGVVEVSNDGGSQTLTKLREATGASSAAEPPRAPFVMSEEDVNAIFGDVIKERPLLPASFTLNFQPGASIFASSGAQIDQIVAEVRGRPISRVAIYGYATSRGNTVINLGSSLFRARAVSSALASRGLDTRDFVIDAIIIPEADGAVQGGAPPDNRRVDVVVR